MDKDTTISMQRELKKLKIELENEQMKSRRYKSEINIQSINMKAQLEIQKIKLEECKEDLFIQKKTEKAENELGRIREFYNGFDNDTGYKKRKYS